MISISSNDNRVVVESEAGLLMEIGAGTGFIERLDFHGLPLINVGCETGPGFDFSVDGFSVPQAFRKWESQRVDGGQRLRLVYEFTDGDADERLTRRYRATHVLMFTETPLTIERRLLVKRLPTGDLTGPDLDRLRSATLLLAGATLGEPELAAISAPMARIVPGTPLTEMLNRPRFFESATDPDAGGHCDVCMTAPDLIPGCVTLEDDAGHHAAIVPIPPNCPAHLRVFGESEGIVIEHEFCCSSYVDTNDEIDAGTQVILLQDGDWYDAAPAIGKLLAAHFPPVTPPPHHPTTPPSSVTPPPHHPTTPSSSATPSPHHPITPPLPPPAWTDNAIIYEAEPIFENGFAGLRAKLPAIKELGVNAVYLMPWHLGGYATVDYYQPEPRFGTIADLKDTIKAAHDLGMVFMFDMLTNIARPDSPMVKERPEFFYRDDRGRPRPHATWGNRCFDPGSPAFREFMIDYACWCVEELGSDGFRVDAAAHRGANWNCLPALQPHEHSHAVFTLLAAIRAAIRKLNPNAILMPECFGPIQSTLGDLVCYQWLEWVDWAMDCLQDGRMPGERFGRAIAEQVMSMPAGTRFTWYSHTHDSLAFLKRDLRGPLAEAYFASLAFLGPGVMFFGGGWGMAARPAPHEADHYRRIFALRTKHNGFADFDLDFPASPDPDVFLFTRAGRWECFNVLTNFSEIPKTFDYDGTLIFTRTDESTLGNGTLEIGPYDTMVVKTG